MWLSNCKAYLFLIISRFRESTTIIPPFVACHFWCPVYTSQPLNYTHCPLYQYLFSWSFIFMFVACVPAAVTAFPLFSDQVIFWHFLKGFNVLPYLLELSISIICYFAFFVNKSFPILTICSRWRMAPAFQSRQVRSYDVCYMRLCTGFPLTRSLVCIPVYSPDFYGKLLL